MGISASFFNLCNAQDLFETISTRLACSVNVSDGHDKPFCNKAIMITNNFKKAWGIPIIDKSQFFKAISIINKSLAFIANKFF